MQSWSKCATAFLSLHADFIQNQNEDVKYKNILPDGKVLWKKSKNENSLGTIHASVWTVCHVTA